MEPEENCFLKDTDKVVISGLSGRIPGSNDVAEFRQHLINGDDMVTADGRRWEPAEILYSKPYMCVVLPHLVKI